MRKHNKWFTAILAALVKLGGEGTLEEIYNEVERSNTIKLSDYTDWKVQIRKNIYLHSSDCDIFQGVPDDENDLIYAPEGKGKGRWGLRNK